MRNALASVIGRVNLVRVFARLIAASLFALSVSVLAAPLCLTGSLDTLIGTTCTIGPLTYTFTSYQSANANSGFFNGAFYVIPGSALMPSQISFSPIGNAFSLTVPTNRTVLAHVNSLFVTGNPNDKQDYAQDSFHLFYTVSDPSGTLMGATIPSAGSFSGTADLNAPLCTGCQLSSGGASQSLFTYSTPNGGTESPSYFGISNGGGATRGINTNVVVNSTNMNVMTSQGPAFSVGYADLTLFDVSAVNGGSGTWDPEATFQYLLSPSGSGTVPEPATLALLAIGLGALAFSRREGIAN